MREKKFIKVNSATSIVLIMIIMVIIAIIILFEVKVTKTKEIRNAEVVATSYVEEIEKYMRNHQSDPTNYPVALISGVTYKVEKKDSNDNGIYLNDIIKNITKKPTNGSVKIGNYNKVENAELTINGYDIKCLNNLCKIKGDDKESTASDQTKDEKEENTKNDDQTPAKDLVVSLSYDEIQIGQTQAPMLNINDKYESVVYTSANTSIASIDEKTGVVKGNNPGSTIITAKIKYNGETVETSAVVKVYRYQVVTQTCKKSNGTCQKISKKCEKTVYYEVTKATCKDPRSACQGNNYNPVYVDDGPQTGTVDNDQPHHNNSNTGCLTVQPYSTTSTSIETSCTVSNEDRHSFCKSGRNGATIITACKQIMKYNFSAETVTNNLPSCENKTINCNESTVNQTNETCNCSSNYSFDTSISYANTCSTGNGFNCTADSSGKSYVSSCQKVYQ